MASHPAAQGLIGLGYEPVPCVGKAPKNSGWQSGEMTAERFDAMRAAVPAAANIGLRCGRLSAVDIDLQDSEHVAAAKQIAFDILGYTQFERVGSKGAMLCYRNATPVSKITVSGFDRSDPGNRIKRRSLIELLGAGQQFIAYGTHPDTGKPYTWISGEWADPVYVPFADLPEVTPDKLRAFADACRVKLAELGYSNVEITDRSTHQAAREAKRREDRHPVPKDYLIRMLACVPPDCPRVPDWIARLGGIQATRLRDVPESDMDAELVEIAQAWSRGDYCGATPDNWDSDNDVENTYYTLTPDRAGAAGFGSLHHIACQNGWTEPPPRSTDGRLGADYVAANANPGDDEVELICGADVEPEEIEWLWQGHYALGKFHLLAGKPEAGKNLLCINTAATLSVGGPWPDGSRAPLGDTIIWSGEDDFADTTLPRFLAAGGDRRRFHCVHDVRNADGTKRPFDPAIDVPRLCRAAAKLPELRYIIVDPVSVVVAGGRGASNNNAEARRALQPLVDLAEQRKIIVEGITHFAKASDKRDVLERVIESTAFTALARIVHVAHRFEDDAKARRWVRVKGNIIKREAGSVVGHEYDPLEVPVPSYPDIRAPRLRWGDALRGNARTLIQEEQKSTKLAEGARLLIDILREHGGSMEVREIQAAATAHCISWRTMEDAKKELGPRIKAKRNLGAPNAGWRWHLIEPEY